MNIVGTFFDRTMPTWICSAQMRPSVSGTNVSQDYHSEYIIPTVEVWCNEQGHNQGGAGGELATAKIYSLFTYIW